jgi:hypothetical protein
MVYDQFCPAKNKSHVNWDHRILIGPFDFHQNKSQISTGLGYFQGAPSSSLDIAYLSHFEGLKILIDPIYSLRSFKYEKWIIIFCYYSSFILCAKL